MKIKRLREEKKELLEFCEKLKNNFDKDNFLVNYDGFKVYEDLEELLEKYKGDIRWLNIERNL